MSSTSIYFVGNDVLHVLTSYDSHTLRIEIEGFNNVTKYADYDVFCVANESEHYRLTVSNYSGDAGLMCYICITLFYYSASPTLYFNLNQSYI